MGTDSDSPASLVCEQHFILNCPYFFVKVTCCLGDFNDTIVLVNIIRRQIIIQANCFETLYHAI